MSMLARFALRGIAWLVVVATAALLLVALVHWRTGQWFEQQREQLQQQGYFSYAGYSVNPFTGSVELRDLRVSSAPTADYLSIPALNVRGLSILQLVLGRRPSQAVSFAAPRIEIYRRGSLYQSWAARSAQACSSSASWADMRVDGGGYLTAAVAGELRESDIFGEFALRSTLQIEPLGELRLQARLQTGRADMTELSLALWPQLEALELALQPNSAALLVHYQQCAEAAEQSLQEWRSTVPVWQLGPVQLAPQQPLSLQGWLAAPQPLLLVVSHSEYSLAEWLGLTGGHRLSEGSQWQFSVAGEPVPLDRVAVAAPHATAESAPLQIVAEQALPSYKRQPWQLLQGQLGLHAKVYQTQRRQPFSGELVEVSDRQLVLLQRHSEGEVRLSLRRATIARVETLRAEGSVAQ